MLALYSGRFIGEIRIKPYLNALLGRGVIAGYQIADRAMKMEGQHGAYAFTHIWCQRNVSTAQFAFLKAHSHVPIIYDMDDLLTSIPDFVASSKRTMMKRIAWCLQQAKAVTVASEKLKQYLERGRACGGEQDHRAQERLRALICRPNGAAAASSWSGPPATCRSFCAKIPQFARRSCGPAQSRRL